MTQSSVIESDPGISPYLIKLGVFEGPLDLLLHLIKENKMDIYNIQIAVITEQYLQYIELMKELNLDIAGDFLVMAATLAHIKSKLLLPPEPSEDDPEEEGKDPREELVKRLLEYQKYKNAAESLNSRFILGRDVFIREAYLRNNLIKNAPRELAEISIFKLVDAFHGILKTLSLEKPHEVSMETLSIRDCVSDIVNKIRTSTEGGLQFADLFNQRSSRKRIVVTFLALLDLIRRGAIKVYQSDTFSEIQLIGTPNVYGEWSYDGTDEYDKTVAEINS
ncbi:MAG: segregation/condensation protein A [Bdellovibrionales bacterium]|nr:segregation/condensation protein A [Bdellovibrionales bacterium]